MTETIDVQELKALIQSVFSPTPEDRHLLLMVDVPDDSLPDTDLWRIRRGLAQDWYGKLDAVKGELGLRGVRLLAYPNVHSNNAELPSWGVIRETGLEDLTSGKLAAMENRVVIEAILAEVQMVLAPTQLSTTAPMKLLARKHNFRAATMPGFTPAMIPAPAHRLQRGEPAGQPHQGRGHPGRCPRYPICGGWQGPLRCALRFTAPDRPCIRRPLPHHGGGRQLALGRVLYRAL